MSMSVYEYQLKARRTQNAMLSPFARKMHALHGMASEVGEIHGIFQKQYQGHNVDRDALIDEMGDLMWFVAELSDVIGITLEEVCERNIEKLKKRYPEGFSEDRSVNRHE